MRTAVYPLLSFGVPFIHMGSEIMRSKAFSRDGLIQVITSIRLIFSMSTSVLEESLCFRLEK